MIFRNIQIFVVVVILELVWYNYAYPNYYKRMLNNINRQETQRKLFTAILSWMFLSVSIWYFCVHGASNATDALIKGAVLGSVLFGFHNSTNYSFLHRYNFETSIIDFAHGVALCACLGFLFKLVDRIPYNIAPSMIQSMQPMQPPYSQMGGGMPLNYQYY